MIALVLKECIGWTLTGFSREVCSYWFQWIMPISMLKIWFHWIVFFWLLNDTNQFVLKFLYLLEVHNFASYADGVGINPQQSAGMPPFILW